MKDISQWGIFPDSHRGPYIIAGPCSAESRLQVIDTATALKAQGVSVFRAGVWKPRTHPGSFEGAGSAALEWLGEAKSRTGVKLCCEVACAAHIEACLRAGVDMLWIGARTSANPFMVQELAQSLRGVDIPVLVKNPVSPDVDLWLGAFERLASCGVEKLGAVHRGVASLRPTRYRNDPAWDMAVQLRTRMPRLPLFCDPSHMGGAVDLLHELAQTALDLGFEGLMVEVHCKPCEALSDAAQQLSPDQFASFVGSLRVPQSPDCPSDQSSPQAELARLRAEIDIIDEDILSVLARRAQVSARIGELKKESNMAIIQSGRWEEVLGRALTRGAQLGLSESSLRAIFSAIHEDSVSRQR